MDTMRDQLDELVIRTVTVVGDLDEGLVTRNTFLFAELSDEMDFDYEAHGLELTEGVSLDSLDMLDMIINLEAEFDVRFDLESEMDEGKIAPQDLASPSFVSGFIQARLAPDVLEAWAAGKA